MIKLEVLRFPSSDKQTLSIFDIYENDSILFSGVMLELSDKDNKKRISRINAGIYTCVKRYSEKYGNHFHVLDVEGRDYILIHSGNYNTDTLGCLIAGASFQDINSDGYSDVIDSKRTIKRMNRILPKTFQLEIFDSELDN